MKKKKKAQQAIHDIFINIHVKMYNFFYIKVQIISQKHMQRFKKFQGFDYLGFR